MVPRVLCITGGMGAGKTVAVDFFREKGWPVYPSDERAKFLVANSSRMQSELAKAFGPSAVLSNGTPNASYLGVHAFSTKAGWETLNEIIHPAVHEDFKIWLHALKGEEFPWVVRESALLFEVGRRADCDRILLVTAPENLRRARIALRNPERSSESLWKRMAFQWDDERKRAQLRSGDFEVANTETKEIFEELLASWFQATFAV
jgi:dephospho-CoA kinase